MADAAKFKISLTYRTPQAQDDHQDGYEDLIGFISIADLLANDLGGAAKEFYGIDQTDPRQAATTAYSRLGAQLIVTDTGEIKYDPTGEFAALIQSLSLGDTLEDSFTYTIRLADGTLSTATVYLLIEGMNDAPEFSAEAAEAQASEIVDGAIGEGAAQHASSGAISFTESDLKDTHTVATSFITSTDGRQYGALSAQVSAASTGAGAGQVTWNFSVNDAELDHLAEGETIEVVYRLTLTDNNGASATKDVTITLTGANDKPIVDAYAGDSAGTATPLLETDAGLIASGTLTVVDTDTSDQVSLAVTDVMVVSGATPLTPEQLKSFFTVTTGSIAADPLDRNNVTWTFNSGTEAFDQLGRDEELILAYTITPSDAQGPNQSGQGTVTIKILGTNDKPSINVLAGDSAGAAEPLVESNSGLTTSGTLTVTDPDLSDVVTVAVTNVRLGEGMTSSFTDEQLQSFFTVTSGSINANASDKNNLTWTFNSGAEAFDYLGDGERLTIYYTITPDDGAGPNYSSEATVTIHIVGTNDGPAAVNDAFSTNEDEILTLDFAAVLANDTDVDGDALSITAVGPATNGVVSIVDDQIVFTPDADFSGQASFEYQISDGRGGTSSATSIIDVAPVADAPLLSASVEVASGGSPNGNVEVENVSGDLLISGNLSNYNNFMDPYGNAAALLSDGSVVITYYQVDSGTAEIVRLLPDGTQLAKFSLPVGGYLAVAALADGGYVVAAPEYNSATGQWGITAHIYDSGNNKVDAATVPGGFRPEVTALASGGFVIAASAQSITYTQAFDAAGTPLGSVIATATDSQPYPEVVGLSDGNYVLMYQSGTMEAKVFAPDGSVVAHVETAAYSSAAALGAVGDGFVIAYRDYGPNSNSNISFQMFDENGVATSPPLQATTALEHEVQAHVVALDSGMFMITWASSTPASGSDIKGQLFDASGNKVGAVFQVNVDPTYNQTPSTVIALSPDTVMHFWTDGIYNQVKYQVEAGILKISGLTTDSTISLDLDAALVDNDGSESLQATTLTGLPPGAVLVDAAGHSFTASSSSDIVDLQNWDLSSITLKTSQIESFDLLLSATSVENGEALSATSSLTIKVDPLAASAILAGTAFSDVISGRTGDDLINGGGGSDILAGNLGLDTFVFQAGEAHMDAVLDFNSAQGDKLVFQGYAAGATLTNIGGDLWSVEDGTVTEVVKLTGVTSLTSADYLFT